MKTRIAVLVSGGGTNLQALIDAPGRGEIPDGEIALVVSNNPNAYALERAKKAGIRTAVCEKPGMEGKIIEALRAHDIDMIVLAGFMAILSKNFVSLYPDRIINIHPALLPSFKGLDAQGQAVDYGVKVAGCTVHFVDEGTDTGPIILQKVVPVLDDDTEETLAARILVEEHKALPEAIQLWADGKLTIKGRKVYVAK